MTYAVNATSFNGAFLLGFPKKVVIEMIKQARFCRPRCHVLFAAQSAGDAQPEP